MGLDMYLTRRVYIPRLDRDRIFGTLRLVGDMPFDPFKVSEVVEDVAYWRKANHIHEWFVENVQEGVDNCGTYHVSPEQLKNLLEACKQTLKWKKNKKKAGEIMPPKSGPFFGDVNIDDSYFKYLEETVKMLTEALKRPHDDFYYHASW